MVEDSEANFRTENGKADIEELERSSVEMKSSATCGLTDPLCVC